MRVIRAWLSGSRRPAGVFSPSVGVCLTGGFGGGGRPPGLVSCGGGGLGPTARTRWLPVSAMTRIAPRVTVTAAGLSSMVWLPGGPSPLNPPSGLPLASTSPTGSAVMKPVKGFTRGSGYCRCRRTRCRRSALPTATGDRRPAPGRQGQQPVLLVSVIAARSGPHRDRRQAAWGDLGPIIGYFGRRRRFPDAPRTALTMS